MRYHTNRNSLFHSPMVTLSRMGICSPFGRTISLPFASTMIFSRTQHSLHVTCREYGNRKIRSMSYPSGRPRACQQREYIVRCATTASSRGKVVGEIRTYRRVRKKSTLHISYRPGGNSVVSGQIVFRISQPWEKILGFGGGTCTLDLEVSRARSGRNVLLRENPHVQCKDSAAPHNKRRNHPGLCSPSFVMCQSIKSMKPVR